MLQNVDQDARESGCWDSCPSKGVLKQIRYERRKIATPPGDVWSALQSIKENQNQMSASSATLQSISLDPPAVIFYSIKTIRILHNVWKDDLVYIDATGNVLLGEQHCYIYEIVVRHPVKSNPPLVVATLITWSHDIPTICTSRIESGALKESFSHPNLVHVWSCVTVAWLWSMPSW